jgi:Domain of unknown function (DUF4417)
MKPIDRLDGANWHFRSDEPLSFNCRSCLLLDLCGGLRVKGPAMDCLRFCCGKQECDMVCPNSPGHYAKRLQEIGGFSLENVRRCAPVKFERLAGYAPLIHHAYSRSNTFPGEIVSLSLYELLDSHGAPKYFSRSDVARQFRIRSDARLIITGVDKDALLERIWRSTHREAIAVMLRSLEVSLVTSPNFSVYNNVPRTENLYNIKRNALVAQELLELRVPVAIHVNACTETDYLRYAEFLAKRPEFEAIAFEFITGPGYPSRIGWHVKKLIELSKCVARPLQLVVRGGTNTLGLLSTAFTNILAIDSDPLQCALRRKRMIFGNDGRVRYVDNKLPKGVPVDDLLVQNALAAGAEVEYALRASCAIKPSVKRLQSKLPNASYADYKSRQLSLLTDTGHRQAGTHAIDNERVVTTAKP